MIIGSSGDRAIGPSEVKAFDLQSLENLIIRSPDLFLLNCGSSSSRPAGLLYVLTQGSNGIGNNVSSFSMNLDNGDLSLINSNTTTCQPPGGSCGAPLDILLDPTG